MAFCRNCGSEVREGTTFCPNCGASQNEAPANPPVSDEGGFLWGLLGCCIPIVGLILYLVWKDTKPKTASAAGKGALVAVVCAVIYYLFVIVIGVGVGLAGY